MTWLMLYGCCDFLSFFDLGPDTMQKVLVKQS
jgi:hypothetical protein